MTKTLEYTEMLEARAAWYAAMAIELEQALEDAQTLREELRIQGRWEAIERLIDQEGLVCLYLDAKDKLEHDAERVALIIAEGRPSWDR